MLRSNLATLPASDIPASQLSLGERGHSRVPELWLSCKFGRYFYKHAWAGWGRWGPPGLGGADTPWMCWYIGICERRPAANTDLLRGTNAT